jgi:ribosomal protein L7/L12
MPVRYRCTSCAFVANIGWYHYHSWTDGFFAATLLLCVRCGARHKIAIAFRQPEPEKEPRCDVFLVEVPDLRASTLTAIRYAANCNLGQAMQLVKAMPALLRENIRHQDADEVRALAEAAGARVEVRIRPELAPPPPRLPVPARRDELHVCEESGAGKERIWKACPIEGERRGEYGEFDLDVQRCHRCSERGTLASTLTAEVNPCPCCGAMTFVQAGRWMT